MHHRQITLAGAALATAIGMAMAAAGSVERAGTALDVALIVAVSVMVTIGAHLLPALSRSLAGRAIWLACIALTLYSHAAFFTAAAGRAGAGRAAAVQADSRTEALRAELAAITARPLAQIAAELASTGQRVTAAELSLTRCEHDTPARCAARRAALASAQQRLPALQTEQAEAQRAATLREQLTGAAQTLDQRRATAAADPVSAHLGALTGLQPDTILTGVSVLGAVVVDLMAALLWSQALSLTTTAATHDANHQHTHAAAHHAQDARAVDASLRHADGRPGPDGRHRDAELPARADSSPAALAAPAALAGTDGARARHSPEPLPPDRHPEVDRGHARPGGSSPARRSRAQKPAASPGGHADSITAATQRAASAITAGAPS